MMNRPLSPSCLTTRPPRCSASTMSLGSPALQTILTSAKSTPCNPMLHEKIAESRYVKRLQSRDMHHRFTRCCTHDLITAIFLSKGSVNSLEICTRHPTMIMLDYTRSTVLRWQLAVEVFCNITCQKFVVKKNKDPGLGAEIKWFREKTVEIVSFFNTRDQAMSSVCRIWSI